MSNDIGDRLVRIRRPDIAERLLESYSPESIVASAMLTPLTEGVAEIPRMVSRGGSLTKYELGVLSGYVDRVKDTYPQIDPFKVVTYDFNSPDGKPYEDNVARMADPGNIAMPITIDPDRTSPLLVRCLGATYDRCDSILGLLASLNEEVGDSSGEPVYGISQATMLIEDPCIRDRTVNAHATSINGGGGELYVFGGKAAVDMIIDDMRRPHDDGHLGSAAT